MTFKQRVLSVVLCCVAGLMTFAHDWRVRLDESLPGRAIVALRRGLDAVGG